MNEQLVTSSVHSPRWLHSPHWYLWDGGFLLLGSSDGVVPAHTHHAIQIVLAISGVVAAKGATGEWREGPGLIIRPDVEHSYSSQGAMGAMIFVDPESSEGVWLNASLAHDITVLPEARLSQARSALEGFCQRPFESPQIRDVIRQSVLSLCPGAPPSRRVDERISLVLSAIRNSEDLRMSAEDAARLVHLSPSRFAHLFTHQVGLPFRRYILWRKLTRAMVAIGRERTIAAAAHASDFADAAHLTRTFYQMVGLAPSVLMRGEFFEIASPFGPLA